MRSKLRNNSESARPSMPGSSASSASSAFGESRNLRRSFNLLQRGLQFLDQCGKSARSAGTGESTDQGRTGTFTRIPQIQVRSKESGFLCGGDQILLEKFAFTHPARRKECLSRNEPNPKRLQVLLRQFGPGKMPRIRSTFGHGWQRFAHCVPAGTENTSLYQPEGMREAADQFATSPFRLT